MTVGFSGTKYTNIWNTHCAEQTLKLILADASLIQFYNGCEQYCTVSEDSNIKRPATSAVDGHLYVKDDCDIVTD